MSVQARLAPGQTPQSPGPEGTVSCREDGDWQPLEANPRVVSLQGVRLEAYQRVCDYPLEVDSRNLARMGTNLVRRGEQPVYGITPRARVDRLLSSRARLY